MDGFKKWDFIKVIDFNRKELKEDEMNQFVGANGIIVNTFGDSGYRHDVVFFNMNLQREAMDDGGILWRDEDLERLEIQI